MNMHNSQSRQNGALHTRDKRVDYNPGVHVTRTKSVSKRSDKSTFPAVPIETSGVLDHKKVVMQQALDASGPERPAEQQVHHTPAKFTELRSVGVDQAHISNEGSHLMATSFWKNIFLSRRVRGGKIHSKKTHREINGQSCPPHHQVKHDQDQTQTEHTQTEHLIHYSPKSYNQTSQILGELRTTIWSAAYTVVPLLIWLPDLVFDENYFPHASRNKTKYMKIWEGESGEAVSHTFRSFVLAAVFSEHIWKKIDDQSLFTKEVREDLEEIAKARYATTEEGKYCERTYATRMEFKHGASRGLAKGSKAEVVVADAMKLLVDVLTAAVGNHDEDVPQVHAIISEMGDNVWKAAINLKNQKGAIRYSFQSNSELLGTTDDRQNLLYEQGERFMWFPRITVNKPQHPYRNTEESKLIVETHPPEYAVMNSVMERNGSTSTSRVSWESGTCLIGRPSEGGTKYEPIANMTGTVKRSRQQKELERRRAKRETRSENSGGSTAEEITMGERLQITPSAPTFVTHIDSSNESSITAKHKLDPRKAKRNSGQTSGTDTLNSNAEQDLRTEAYFFQGRPTISLGYDQDAVVGDTMKLQGSVSTQATSVGFSTADPPKGHLLSPLFMTRGYQYRKDDPETPKSSIEVRDPSTAAVLSTLSAHSTDDVKCAIEEAHDMYKFLTMNADINERAAWLMRLHDCVLQHADTLARIIVSESGKLIRDAKEEVKDAGILLSWYAKKMKERPSSRKTLGYDGCVVYITKCGVGVVGFITAWQFPLGLIVRKVAQAIAAGCTIIVIPSTLVPHSALALHYLATQAGIPKGIIHVLLTKDRRTLRELVVSPQIRALSICAPQAFIQKTLSVRDRRHRRSGSVNRTSTEACGNAYFIVFPEADIHVAVLALLEAKFRTSPTGVGINRVFVHVSVVTQFLEKLVPQVKNIQSGDPFCSNTTQGPVPDESALKKCERHVRNAQDEGAEILTGGHKLNLQSASCGNGYYFAPTVLKATKDNLWLIEDQVLGPIIVVFDFDTEEDLIQRANKKTKTASVGCYIFTQDIEKYRRVSEQLGVKRVAVNTTWFSETGEPIAGLKSSLVEDIDTLLHGLEETRTRVEKMN